MEETMNNQETPETNEEETAAEETVAVENTAEGKVLPSFGPGDTIKVHARIKEGDKERIQMFQGVVLKIKQAADGGNFTVRRISYGVGVERTFPFLSPNVTKVEIMKKGKVRRARLFYLRKLSGKAARIKEVKQTPS
ncbi:MULTISPECIES: 50S ribosomal protein L19 [Dehalococcoides]|uniref:Large ribosomal subunit protein bL19 n=1 Tax=Dehalococcoides mccartyi (strain VS) TaxID=311424 RepID=D2BGJ0_DEHMV|nr:MULTISPECIES: 50S ribosomal protein L19 [Dehalococcoides]ACZ61440.1 ribosomal protein L19 [Dehalococcoides mccartyi VS]AHB13049.1 50S ribosomal protein L19 [Dehalococcoides mccartyi GY50]AII57493.1 50S ribosomal protein L19 [Dehalococcoides mccartyi CG1]QYY58401.1 50S ribosomal protein L19 [Dehalococcoides mccartyi]BAQ34231.1 50S ribosomal protein L19 [Dehalococcoides sp. UCH007]